MVLDEIVQIVTIIGSIAGIIALIWQYKDYKQKAPNVTGILHHADYEITKLEDRNTIKLNASFLIQNMGSTPSSITDSIAIIKFQQGLDKNLSYNAVKGTVNHTKIPCDIKANGATRIELDYSIDVSDPLILDRCAIPYNIRDPKHPKPEDLPLAIRFFIKHTYGQFDTIGCVYRKDQPESQRIKGEQGGLCFSQNEMGEQNPKLILME
jgi:hypothetical protein